MAKNKVMELSETERNVLVCLYKHNCHDSLFPGMEVGANKKAVKALDAYRLIDACFNGEDIIDIRMRPKGRKLAEELLSRIL